ncbi:polyketide synthase, partial [Nocardia sp. NPDC048505]|uniref:beta-ketoacyl [acyl carrier protein] synthase domain-containing protein n=1 Tax=Nocardia sp. NPDC048505 TaxID=3155756 RepID=UPI0033F045FF
MQSNAFDTRSPRDIAVVGLACRVPGADDPHAFWSLLRAGESRDSDPREYAAFDAAFFGISPAEAAQMDPQQRLALELSWEVCESGGLAIDELRGTPVGVFVGVMADDYSAIARAEDAAVLNRFTKTGLGRSMIANRVSHFMGWRGPSLCIDTGQSSSLVAVHLACESLRRGESSVALAGGVQLNLDSFGDVVMSEFGAVSPDRKVYAFDSRANGTVRGQGGAIIALKLLNHALRDGDEIFAVIRGSAVNNDGATEGVAVPGVAAQQAVVRQACLVAQVDPGDVQYVELHGTGTVVGDRVEAKALANAYRSATADHGTALLVGSVKTNIGHLEAAAGIVGLLKVILALRYRQIPPSLNYAAPSPHVPTDRLRVVDALRFWEPQPAGRLAGVSAFGMGGTNAHVIIAEAPAPAEETGAPEQDSQLLSWVLSGRTPTALTHQATRLHHHLTTHNTPPTHT